MSKETDIGFGKKIRLSWLECAHRLADSNVDLETAKSELDQLVRQDNPGDAAVSKILGLVSRVWLTPPQYSVDLQEEALELARPAQSSSDRLAVHFGKAILSYPFVGVTAEACGRLIRIQDNFITAEVVRRIQERYGDRGFTQRCARYNISSFIDWGVLVLEGKNRYGRAKGLKIENERIIRWLLTVVMRVLVKGDIGLSEIRHHPALFPFSLPEITPRLLTGSKYLVIKRSGLNQEVLSIESRD